MDETNGLESVFGNANVALRKRENTLGVSS
jgi:hypothetical protein